jgi:hypothetical protein
MPISPHSKRSTCVHVGAVVTAMACSRQVIHQSTASAAVKVLPEAWQALTAVRGYRATDCRISRCLDHTASPSMTWANCVGSSIIRRSFCCFARVCDQRIDSLQ